jgi:tyrosyl-tRNA synthetase
MQNAVDQLKSATAMLNEAGDDKTRKEAAEETLVKAAKTLMNATAAFVKARDEKVALKLGGTRRHRRKHRKTLRRK